MVDDDLAQAARLSLEAFARPSAHGGSPEPTNSAESERVRRRLAHFLRSDPAGSWVATERGRVVGLSQAFVREDLWILSLLAVSPDAQGRGLGAALLRAALEYGDPSGPGLIQASPDPGAVALYSAAGFDLHPAVEGRGTPRHPIAPSEGVRTGDDEDLGLAADIDRAIRHAERTIDLCALLAEPGCQLLVDGERGYAAVKPGRLVIVAALDERSAGRLLRAAIARVPPGECFEVGWITARQQWAIKELVAAGVALAPKGPLMVRGLAGPPAPYIPSGGYG